MLDSATWRKEFNKHWGYEEEKVELFDRFEDEVIKRFEQYQIPGIQLVRDTPKEAVCQVFEKVNTGGVTLNVFELLTATFAADDFNLRDDWDARLKKFEQTPSLRGLESTDFLQAIALLKTYDIRLRRLAGGTCRSKRPASPVSGRTCSTSRWTTTRGGPTRSLRASSTQHGSSCREDLQRARHSIPDKLVPLAAILARLGEGWKKDGARARLSRWYWCGVFGEMYGGSTESRFANDLPQVLAWIDGGPEPDTVRDANFSPDRLYTLRTRNSAAYKGLLRHPDARRRARLRVR